MAPKQVPRRARAQGKGKGKGISLGNHTDRESGLYRQLPADAQRDIQLVARTLMNTFDDMPLDIAIASANRLRREEREIFDHVLAPPMPPCKVIRDGVTVYEGNDMGEMELILQPGDRVENATGQGETYLGPVPLVQSPPWEAEATTGKGKGKGKGFEPFSGKGRRLDDLDSLD